MILLFPSLVHLKSDEDKANFKPRYVFVYIYLPLITTLTFDADATCSTASASWTSPTVCPSGLVSTIPAISSRTAPQTSSASTRESARLRERKNLTRAKTNKLCVTRHWLFSCNDVMIRPRSKQHMLHWKGDGDWYPSPLLHLRSFGTKQMKHILTISSLRESCLNPQQDSCVHVTVVVLAISASF